MFRGLLKTRSKDLNNLQRIIDPLIIIFIFNIALGADSGFLNINNIIAFFINAIILNANKIYQSYRIRNLINIIPQIIFVSSTLTIINLFIRELISPLNGTYIFKVFYYTFIYLFIHHFLLRYLLRRMRSKGYNSRNAIFIGNNESFKNVQKQLRQSPWIGYKICYWFSTNSSDFKNSNCDGGIDDFKEISKTNGIDKVFFSHDDNDEIKFNTLLKVLGDTCIQISYMMNLNLPSLSLKKEYFGEIVALNIWNPEESIFNKKIKRIFDFTISTILIFFLLPFFILISIAIKTSSKGGIIFKQKRYGLNGKEFNMYKFRTMYIDPKLKSKKLAQAKLGDKRITNVGKFLRKYSLDEFPQLINVLKGDMSLVGPRPHAVEHNEYYRNLITGYMQRHSKIPGMTGLAQINGARGETKNLEDMKLRIKYDIEYNNNWSLFKDFSILVKTFFSILKGTAY